MLSMKIPINRAAPLFNVFVMGSTRRGCEFIENAIETQLAGYDNYIRYFEKRIRESNDQWCSEMPRKMWE